MSRPTGLGEYSTAELLAELEAREQADQYTCPSYYDDEGVLRDCECGRCGDQPDNTQVELDEILSAYAYQVLEEYTTNAGLAHGIAKQAILDWHNKQVEQLVGEIEEIKLSGSNADQRRLGRNMLRKQILDKLKESN